MNESITAEIDLMEDAVYVVKQGTLTKINAMEYGTDRVIWSKGIVLDVERSQRIRLNGGKNIDTNADGVHIDEEKYGIIR